MDRQKDALIGRVLDGRYRVGPKIARGGMATVYEATDLRLDRTVAVKVMHEGMADDEEFVRRFQREARSAARLSHHNVVAVFDTGDDNGTLFLVMEYVPGLTLRDLIRKEAPMSPAKTLALMDPVLSALSAAHDAGLIHRDVKPENVLLADDGRVKVADFGLSRAVNAETQHTATGGVLIGTVSYLSPELVVNGKADARADVYAAGVLIYEMLTGVKPHQADSPIQVAYKHVHEDIPPPSARMPGLPAYVDALVARATARDPFVRPADARVLLHQVRRVRDALDHGVTDDPELLEDLNPTATVEGRTPTGELPAEIIDPHDYQPEQQGYPPTEAARSGAPSILPGHPGPRPPGPPQPVAAYSNGARGSRRGPVLLVLLLLLAGLVGFAGWYFGIGRYTDTPGVLRMPQAAAAAKVEQAHLAFKVSGQDWSENVPKGAVLRTSPGAGDKIRKDGTVSAVLSRGPERHNVPQLSGRSADDARNALEQARLNAGHSAEQFSETVAAGLVIASDPPAGTALKRDATVNLVISKGPKPIPVPDLTSRPGPAARKQLRDLGFKIDQTRSYSDTVPAGRVVSQSPSSGEGKKGDVISLTVSRGPQLVTVPGVKGMGLDAATSTLEGAGFQVKVAQSSIYVGLQYVVDSKPGEGSKAPRGSVITVYIV